jgi:2-hydroxy-6-oxonona-2,4-dienedioate hydrolase
MRQPNSSVMSLDVFDDDRFLYRAPRGKRPHVVLLPGLVAGSWMWEPTMELLSANGFGYLVPSDMFAGIHHSVAPIKAWVAAGMDRHGIASAVMVGGSFGSRIALDFALEFPERVESLVLSGAPGSITAARRSVKFGGKVTRPIVTTAFEWVIFDHSLIRDDMVNASLESFKDPRRVLSLIRLMKGCESYDYAAALKRINAFVLMIWGADDRISPSELWERLAAETPHGAFFAIDRCGHTPMIERPEEFNAILLDYLQPARKAARA